MSLCIQNPPLDQTFSWPNLYIRYVRVFDFQTFYVRDLLYLDLLVRESFSQCNASITSLITSTFLRVTMIACPLWCSIITRHLKKIKLTHTLRWIKRGWLHNVISEVRYNVSYRVTQTSLYVTFISRRRLFIKKCCKNLVKLSFQQKITVNLIANLQQS